MYLMGIIATARGNLSAFLNVPAMKGKEWKCHPGWKGPWKMSVDKPTQSRVTWGCSWFYAGGSETLPGMEAARTLWETASRV